MDSQHHQPLLHSLELKHKQPNLNFLSLLLTKMLNFMRDITTAIAAAACILSVAAAPAAASNSAPTPPNVSISNIIYGGTGCPQNSAYVLLSSDKQSFTAYFSRFFAYLNTGNDDIKDSRKFCQFNLAVNSPPGWQFTIVQTSFSGYAALGSGVTATHTSTNYFTGSTDDQTYSVSFAGPAYREFTIGSTSVVGDGEWSPCGTQALLNIKSELLLSGTGSGAIVASKESGELTRIFALQWRNC
ncbi:hypothetical protein TWF694_009358 [Orbilia ellipsospora]|uniref:Secreted protein n=1 Tax=Orbilia ellipsospora TaxID=2528407 RepID=A0AAV9XG33_9PEZI